MKTNKKSYLKRILWGILCVLLIAPVITGFYMMNMPGKSATEPLTELSDSEAQLAEQLERDVRHLAEDIGERNMFTGETMQQTTEWLEKRFGEAGFETRRHTYHPEIVAVQGDHAAADNIIAELPGEENPDEIIVIGAHYDSVPDSPGANDNASAVATLLALAEWFADRPQPRTIRFVSFANEEPPFFYTSDMGSYAYARKCKERGDNITAMIALDGLGYFSNEEESQHYPAPGISLFYPDKANFIGFVTRMRDAGLLRKTLRGFRERATIPSEGAALPGFIPGVYWSDHWSFWQHDFPALLVTDTLLYRDRQYHTPGDTPDRLDFNRMARVAEGLKYAVKGLAE